MKNLYKKIAIAVLFAFCLFRSADVFSQTIGFNYQAVISDPQVYQVPGKNIVLNHLVSTEIAMRFSIVDAAGTHEYSEEHTTQTNKFGEVNLIIGTGQKLSAANFSDIRWDGGQKQLYVEIDYKRGTGYEYSNTQNLLYLPHPLNRSDRSDIDSNIEVINAIKQAAGLDDDGRYRIIPSTHYISLASSLSEADNRLDAAVKTNAQAIENYRDNQNISGSGLSGTLLTIGIERGNDKTVDLSSLQDGTGSDDQKGTEVPLKVPLVIDGTEVTTVEAAIVELNKGLDALASTPVNNQQLSLNDQHILTLDNGGAIDLSPYFNTVNASQVDLVTSLDVDGDTDTDPEQNVEEAITALIDILFGCTTPTACNYDASAIFADGNCTNPSPGEDCDGVQIGVGIQFQGGFVFSFDPATNSGLIVTASDFPKNTWNPAVYLCDVHNVGAYNDWYLPSKDELQQLHQQKQSLEGKPGFTNFSDTYWSKSEINGVDKAHIMQFNDGSQLPAGKSELHYIRAIRSF